MSDLALPLFTRHVRGAISSSPLLVDANGDGWPEIFVGGPVLQGLTWEGDVLPRWPKRARRPFASSPSFGDFDGSGRGEIVVGCDDGTVHAYHVDGDPVRGWPLRTGADVFSTPALVDVDGDGRQEAVVGSDDGALYVIRGDGTLANTAVLRGRPFVSASPTLADLDGDGRPEVAIGAWNHAIHLWSPVRKAAPRRIADAGHVVWSSATAFQIRGRGWFLAWASDRMYVTRADGTTAQGWPRRTESWSVSSPCVAELVPGDGATIVVGSDRLYAWDVAGRPRPGWPVDTGDFVWSSPLALDLDGDGIREILAASWDGKVYAFRPDGLRLPGFPLATEGPIFGTPALAALPEGGGLLAVASWDGSLRAWRLPQARFSEGDWPQFRGAPSRHGSQSVSFPPPSGNPEPPPMPQGAPKVHAARVESWAGIQRLVVEGEALELARRIQMDYRISGEGKGHPVPVVKSRGGFVALVQPLRLPRRIRYRVEVEALDGQVQRWPTEGHARFTSHPRLRISLRPQGAD